MFVYILASKTCRLYVGVTSQLVRQVWEHKTGVVAGFTRRYGIDQLVYYEVIKEPAAAIQREKQIKSYARTWPCPGLKTMGGPIPRYARDDAL